MITSAQTIQLDIFIAGDLAKAKQICREFCFEIGLCVTVAPVDYIYTGGEESGVRVGLINYPRFPVDKLELENKAYQLAQKLMFGLCQHSFSIVGPEKTEWFSRRPDGSPLTSHNRGGTDPPIDRWMNKVSFGHCQCKACRTDGPHESSCAVHNAPALPVGSCNCGVVGVTASIPQETSHE